MQRTNTTSYSTIEEEKYELENGTVHKNFKNSGLWTNNFENYWKSKCFGLLTICKDKSINLNMKMKQAYGNILSEKNANYYEEKCKISEKAH